MTVEDIKKMIEEEIAAQKEAIKLSVHICLDRKYVIVVLKDLLEKIEESEEPGEINEPTVYAVDINWTKGNSEILLEVQTNIRELTRAVNKLKRSK